MTDWSLKYGEHTIPFRCRYAFYALRGNYGTPPTVRYSGFKWRYADIQFVTGRSSVGKKMRELREACPGLICEELPEGANYKVFWLAPADAHATPHRDPVSAGSDGVLFTLPDKGRPE